MRNGLVDCLRLLCAFGIVWFHSQAPGHRIAYVALPFFLVLLALPSRRGVQERGWRLLRPWLVWSMVYMLFEIMRSLQAGRQPFAWLRIEMLLYGPSIHLWFLPFSLLAVLLAAPLAKRPGLALAITPLAALGVALSPGVQTAPFGQWLFGAVPLLTGIAFFAQSKRCRPLAFLALAAAWVILEALRPNPDNTTILIGSVLALAAFMVQLPSSRASNLMARLSFPVYLSHPIFIFVGYYIGFNGVIVAVFACLSSLIFSAGIVLVERRFKVALT